MSTDQVLQLAAENQLDVLSRGTSSDYWNDVLQAANFIPFFYSHSSLSFQSAYQQGHGNNWQDHSLVILWDKKPAAILPLGALPIGPESKIGSFGMPLLPPVFCRQLAPASRKKISQNSLAMVNAMARQLQIESWESIEYFRDVTGLSDWHAGAMSAGASCSLSHDLYINLEMPLDEIKRGFRKSYKSLVTSGMREWQVAILDHDEENIWNEFRDLHYQVSGRKTRSDETWDIHYKDILQGQGVLIYLRDANDRMTGAGFFNYTRDEGLYAVAAYDRALFDKPLGHVVQYKAIEYLKEKGVRWYKIGNRAYSTNQPPPSDKEISISEFKQGFASHLIPVFELKHVVGVE